MWKVKNCSDSRKLVNNNLKKAKTDVWVTDLKTFSLIRLETEWNITNKMQLTDKRQDVIDVDRELGKLILWAS